MKSYFAEMSFIRDVLAVIALLGSTSPAFASLTPGKNGAYARVEALSSFRPNTGPEIQKYEFGDVTAEGVSFTTTGANRLAMVSGASGPIGSTAASGWAVAGAAGVTAATTATGVPNGSTMLVNGSFGRAESGANWWDTVLVTSPNAANGSTGVLRASLVVSGGLLTTVGPRFSQSFAAFSVTGIGLSPVGGFDATSGCALSAAYCTYASAGGYNGWADGTRVFGSSLISVMVPFVFGTPFELGFRLSANAFAQGITFEGNQTFTQADGSASFGSSVLWGGIDGIFRGSSQIGTYSIESASGTNFRSAVASPVPEVPAVSLMLAGLAGLGVLRRRTRTLV